MEFFIVTACVLLGLTALFLIASYVCFYLTFYSPKRKFLDSDEILIPDGDIYEPFREQMTIWTKELRGMPKKELEVKSFDGLTLRGRYYETTPDSIIELMFPGYRGDAERDLCGGVHRCKALGRSSLIVDQRAGGRSDGHVITFGVKESRDVLSWIEVINKEFGTNRRIVLTGISMGAATVLAASGYDLPKNVVGIIADCGYTTPEKIIKKVIKDLKLPVKLVYPFIKAGAFIYGNIRLDSVTPEDSVRKCRVPVFFAHGDDDAFVPVEMSKENFDNCKSHKLFLRVKGAGHGLSFLVSPEEYIDALREIEKEYE